MKIKNIGCPKCGSLDYEITITETLGRFQKAKRTCNKCLNVWFYRDDEINIEEAEKFNSKLDLIIKDPSSYTKEQIDKLKEEASNIIHQSILKLPQNVRNESIDRLIECLVTASFLEAYRMLLESCRNDIHSRRLINEDLRR